MMTGERRRRAMRLLARLDEDAAYWDSMRPGGMTDRVLLYALEMCRRRSAGSAGNVEVDGFECSLLLEHGATGALYMWDGKQRVVGEDLLRLARQALNIAAPKTVPQYTLLDPLGVDMFEDAR